MQPTLLQVIRNIYAAERKERQLSHAQQHLDLNMIFEAAGLERLQGYFSPEASPEQLHDLQIENQRLKEEVAFLRDEAQCQGVVLPLCPYCLASPPESK